MAGSIFFVGLMGAGKTTIGRILAKHLGKTFYDTDQEIERRTGVKIPLIFDVEGEAGFRRRETCIIDELCRLPDTVLATGGGAVLLAENRQNLQQNGFCIYLRANVNELWHRTRNDKNRPLLQTANPKEKLEQLFAERDPLYREIAAMVIDTGGQSINAIVQQIEAQQIEAQRIAARKIEHNH